MPIEPMVDHLVDVASVVAPGGPLALALDHPDRLRRTLDVARKRLPRPLLHLGDRLSEPWLERNVSPYRTEIETLARTLGRPGALALNLSFEWGCTTGQIGSRLLRTLDWPFKLGRDIIVAHHAAPSGPYANITWAGYLGVLTGLARGRFAAALNQAPLAWATRRRSLGKPIDWLAARIRLRDAVALPPSHLLRLVFERAPDYETALRLLIETPICLPAIFTLTGVRPGQGCVVERSETDAFVFPFPASAANHWTNETLAGLDRPPESRARQATMRRAMANPPEPWSWLCPPILNHHTCLAAELDAAAGTIRLKGFDGLTPVTTEFCLAA